ncbi:MAG: GntR family transcriptional regulator [Deltaproteobacteria bacterium]|nr:GntR family transcriptional regulator [Deltaproteobacteria bacterium]
MDPREIFEDLKHRVVSLDIEPEANLNLSDLAAYYGVSRTPVKEAIIYLEAEDWVYRNGNHFTVSPLTLDRMRDTTEIRLILEVEANVLALRRMTPDTLAILDRILEKISNLDKVEDNQELSRLDTEFHRVLYQATGNKQLAALLERMLSGYLRFWRSRPKNVMSGSFFHQAQEIIKAIKDKDEAKLRELSVTHIMQSMNAIMGMY